MYIYIYMYIQKPRTERPPSDANAARADPMSPFRIVAASHERAPDIRVEGVG